MGQIYNGTLIIQTKNYDSPTGDYTLLPLGNPAQSGDVKDSKQGYDGAGNIIIGTNEGGYAGEVSSYEEMDSYLTEGNIGRILKYIGEEEKGNSVPANPIEIGDTLSAIFYDTSARPDFSNIDWGTAAADTDKMLPLIKGTIEKLGEIDVLTAFSNEDGSYGFYFIDADFYYHDATEAGWISAAGEKDAVYDIGIKELNFADLKLENVSSPTIAVTEVTQQDIWGAYISKDGKWNLEPKYKTNQTYIIESQSGEIKALPISE